MSQRNVGTLTAKISPSVYKFMLNQYNNDKTATQIFLSSRKLDYVMRSKFEEIKGRWDVFVTKNGRNPNFILIVEPVTPKVGPYAKKIMDGSGKSWKNHTEFLAFIKKYCEWIEYFNNKKSPDEEANDIISSFKGKPIPMNCVDFVGACVKIAREAGYKAVAYGVHCPKQDINHAIYLISGGEFKSETWIDPSAMCESGYNIGSHWCNGELTKEPSWIPYE